MGREVSKSRFSPLEFKEFKNRLHLETNLLKRWFAEENFVKTGRSIGLELETWLVDKDYLPVPANERFLKKMNHSMVVPELSRFNLEINASPQPLKGECLSKTHKELKKTWRKVQKCARSLKLKVVMIGSLPTLQNRMLGIKNMSDMDRYRALNEQIMFLRKGRDLRVKIEGEEKIEVSRKNVMLEAGGTSLQIHLKLEPKNIARHYNAAIIASAPVVAAASNAPFLFGKNLWIESRIPLFEQAVRLPGFHSRKGQIVRRVTFGSGYVRHSMLECYWENLKKYPVLLPMLYDAEEEWLAHLRLHNGTIWRWNRPIIGLNKRGLPHLRIEHRVASAGPTLVDTMANIAFSVGLIHSLAKSKKIPEKGLSFETARSNFYQAARYGLEAKIDWIDQKAVSLQSLIKDELIPAAKKGLKDLGVDLKDIRFYLDKVMAKRIESGQTGAVWQRGFVARHGRHFKKLTKHYFELQEQDLPVHEWKI